MGIDPECCTHCGYLFDSHAPTTTECPTTREERIANRLSRLYAWRRA
jgi:predicted Zn-ribbon and HTH transcriptional regulator